MQAYRTDIDGLRAIAVLSVVMFHAGLSSWLPGGFVGVDVFFVISGYLISGILMREMETSTFSIIRFYERRLRRIIPALFAMIIVSSGVAAFILLPSETDEFARSIISTVLFSSNIFFYNTTNYFDGGVTRPLLHTWSLAVEEQFYIVFPVLLWAALKAGSTTFRMSIIVALFSSLALCVWITPTNSSFAFYLPPTRAWELLAGSLMSLRIVPRPKTRWLKDAMSIVGLAALAYSFVAFDEGMPFPGYIAALPVLGTALIIASGQDSLALGGKILSWRPLVFVGLCSYSIYLWHWPLIVFVKLVPDVVVSQGRLFGLTILALSISAGYVSWRFVERPFRSKQTFSAVSVYSLFAVTASTLVIMSLTAISMNGWSTRYSSEAQKTAAFLHYNDTPSFRRGTCFITQNNYESYNPGLCMKRVAGRKNFLLVGDSHGAHLWFGLSRNVPANIMQATASGCRPLYENGKSTSACERLFRHVYQEALVSRPVDALLIAGRWQMEDLPKLETTLKWAKSQPFPVVIFGPVPEYDQALPRLIAFAHERSRPNLAQAHLIRARRKVDGEVRALVERYDLPYVSLIDAMCSDGVCKTEVNQAPMQFDYGHLTAQGSDWVIAKVNVQLTKAVQNHR